MIAVWESDISTDSAFFRLLGKLFHNMAPLKRSYVSNNWCLVWTGSVFPQSFLSCKQSDAERKDFVDIPEQSHSWFYTSLRLFVSFVFSSQSRVERRWFTFVSKDD